MTLSCMANINHPVFGNISLLLTKICMAFLSMPGWFSCHGYLTCRLLDAHLVSCIFNQSQVMQLLADHQDWGLKMKACYWLHILFYVCQMLGVFFFFTKLCKLNTGLLWRADMSLRPLPTYFLGSVTLSTANVGWWKWCLVRKDLVQVWIFSRSVEVQWIIPKEYVKTEVA